MSRHQQGVSLVELMVGIAVGLFIVATASFAVSNQLNDNRKLALEAQVEQDLRAAADLIARDLRRAGYWQNAALQFASSGSATNRYAAVTAAGQSASYAYSQDAPGHDNDVLDSNEQSGVKLDSGTLKLLMGDGGWQAITDPAVVTVTGFRLTMNTHELSLAAYCDAPCPPSGTPATCPPVQQVRELQLQINGTAASDARVTRSLNTTVRLRNDRVVGSCGA
ncbi:PilW family protein [Ideonella sp. BN130291]|uniref:PilW family protein n=1 Tax=Ideonella sp. BN130291 TaxID=3112940 RepID=UPI002E2730AD|nr:prepilin-type N-terminal cleavage/methylation domain-containing protein [Ideonella sp. BN130291]